MRDLIDAVKPLAENSFFDLSPTECRLLRSYCDKNDFDLQTLAGMTEDERNVFFQSIIDDPKRYPTPITEPNYFYHGTTKDRIPLIKRDGLIPSKKSRWSNTTIGTDHSMGRIFFSSNLDVAEWYATRWTKKSIILRVPSRSITEFEVDPEERDSIFVTAPVVPSQIEAWNGRKWVRL